MLVCRIYIPLCLCMLFVCVEYFWIGLRAYECVHTCVPWKYLQSHSKICVRRIAVAALVVTREAQSKAHSCIKLLIKSRSITKPHCVRQAYAERRFQRARVSRDLQVAPLWNPFVGVLVHSSVVLREREIRVLALQAIHAGFGEVYLHRSNVSK